MFSNESANQPQTTLIPDQLLSCARDNKATMRLRIKRDLLPGGYQAARAPVLADWSGGDPFISHIPDQLDAAGLLERRDGKPRQIHYSRDGTRPYDRFGDAVSGSA